jgi:cytochrome c-type protein NapB
MNTRHLFRLAAAAWLAAASTYAIAQQPGKPRGDIPIEATSNVDSFRTERDRQPIPRDFVQQPPLIPHTVQGYNITKNYNKCMDCHSWARYQEEGATKVSIAHFKDAEGRELSNISPRRYFCTQCHVPQTEARPLVANEFQPVRGLRGPQAK